MNACLWSCEYTGISKDKMTVTPILSTKKKSTQYKKSERTGLQDRRHTFKQRPELELCWASRSLL